jgi:ABC-2 type transport system permease protein
VKNIFTFAYRALLKSIHNPESFMDITIMPIMFTLMFVYLFGGAISGSTSDYLPILIPGILIMTFVTSSGTSGTQIREDIEKSTTNRFKSMPIARIAPIAGALIADLVRFAVAGTVVFVMGYLVGFRPEGGVLAVVACILFAMMVGWCISWGFTYVSLSVKSVSTSSTAAMLIMFPLTFLSNAFVPTETMPHALQFFVNDINPLTKVISSGREMLNSGTFGSDIWYVLLCVLVILLIFIPLTVNKYSKETKIKS